ncbi:hypothetical protein H0A36_25955 [Endozoicomonas sp. SM1973]|uniref:Uncharacterized protein n=1 Tax=Spartinivicinus marinus TaxID=2994442 RepID=A0A853IK59_9GAMM|nr:hypothetical protein [Spartinivicinus marinus]NYZ69465.1 hypothetical protein [Spartinivicinus marinus]
MAGLGKGLTKNEKTNQIEDFIGSATANTQQPKPEKNGNGRAKKHKSYMFSLTKPVSDDIDKISLKPRDFKVSRSEVVKAGIEALKALPKEQLLEILKEVKASS